MASRLQEVTKLNADSIQALDRFLPNPGGPKGKSAADSLCPTDTIRDKTLVNNRAPTAPLAEPPHAALNFIQHEQQIVSITNLPQSKQEFAAGGINSALTLHRFDKNGGRPLADSAFNRT